MGGGSSSFVASQKVEYSQAVVPESMNRAFQIIERLLTQNQSHEHHVLYKAYPAAKIEKKALDDEEDENKNKGGLGRKKVEKVEEDTKPEEEELKAG
jgi:hypothetical protein